ncbi:MAG: FAD-dependent oxidoreductase [bacterium]
MGVAAPGVFGPHGDALRAPWGRVSWAGTETADRWMGFMDGALRSGQRAALEVLAPPPVIP